jgi:rod shape-determining protein MreD
VILEILTYLFRLIVIVILQLLVVNNIELSSLVNPYIYVAFILLLPISMKPWMVVVISFLTGAIIDAFSSTPGLHIAAANLMGYLRYFYLAAATTKEDQIGNIVPSISQKGIVWFNFYAFALIFVHHFALFFLEIYTFREFFSTLLRIILSTFVSLLLINIGQLLFYNVGKSNE